MSTVPVSADELPEPPSSTPPTLGDHLQIWLVRHGETSWSRSGQHTGRTDLPLTDLGERQALAVPELIGQIEPAFVLSSPRQRALKTAELAGLRVDRIDDDLAEWDYGDFEGLTSPQIHETYPGWTVWSGPWPGGETAEQVTTRADRVLTLAAEHSGAGPVVLVAHGHISRVLATRWLGQPISFGAHLALDTASPSLLGAQHGVPTITHWNIPNPVRA